MSISTSWLSLPLRFYSTLNVFPGTLGDDPADPDESFPDRQDQTDGNAGDWSGGEYHMHLFLLSHISTISLILFDENKIK